MTVLRDVTAADLPAVRRLIGQLGYAPDEAEFRARFERVQASPGHRVIVAEADGAVVGVLHVFERPALDKGCEAVVQALVVDDRWRGHGIGEALMREAEGWAHTGAALRRPRSTPASIATGHAPSTNASAIAGRRRRT